MIRRDCNEGHDVLTAADMFAALKTRPIKGCTAAVCEIDPTVKEIKANKILNFSSFHNFPYKKNGLRMWKAFEIGSGQLLSWSTLQVEIPDGNLSAKPVSENLDFWDVLPRFVQLQKEADSESSLFECNEGVHSRLNPSMPSRIMSTLAITPLSAPTKKARMTNFAVSGC